jgi:Icc-related predicted phosphoesterase
VKILLISDEEDKYLWDYYRPGALEDIDLILSAGDLKPDYLSFLVTMARCPLLYVHGNHDERYKKSPPEGCDCVDDRIITVNGLRILGLGGAPRYNDGPWQFTERQMTWRIRKLSRKIKIAGGVDLVLTHAPVRGYGDQENMAHRGFEAFLPLLDRWKPRYLIHGHVHQRYQPNMQRILQYRDTTIINACGKYYLETEKE